MAVPKKSRSKSLVKFNKLNYLKKDLLKLNKFNVSINNLQNNKVIVNKKILLY
jgi:hypothetical protein